MVPLSMSKMTQVQVRPVIDYWGASLLGIPRGRRQTRCEGAVAELGCPRSAPAQLIAWRHPRYTSPTVSS